MKKILYIAILTFLVIGSADASQMNDVNAFRMYFAQKTLSDAVATGIFKVAVPASGYAGGTISYNIQVTDNTDFQSHAGVVSFSAVNKAGALTTGIVEAATLESNANSAGTLTDAWTVTTGTNEITVNVNANSSLTPTSMIIFYTVIINSNRAIQPL